MELSATEENQGGKGVDRRELQKNELFSSSLRSVKTLTIVIFFFFKVLLLPVFYLRNAKNATLCFP